MKKKSFGEEVGRKLLSHLPHWRVLEMSVQFSSDLLEVQKGYRNRAIECLQRGDFPTGRVCQPFSEA